MSTLSLLPLTIAGFRSNADWTELEYHDTQRPFSDFDFVETYFGRKEHANTITRILSLARQLGFQSLLKEKLSDNSSLKQDADSRVQKNDLDFKSSEIYRLSFFACSADQTPKPEDFLGYAVIKADSYKNSDRPRIYVYESVLAPHRPEDDRDFAKSLGNCPNFLHCKRTYEIENTFGKFSVTGAMYAQQNGRNFICAHVALRSVLSLLNDDDIAYHEIDRLAGRPSHSRDGLTPTQIDTVLRERGVVARRTDRRQLPAMGVSFFSPLLYGYIESGCPSLLAFFPRGGVVGHIVPVLGHTFDADSWVPESRNGYLAGGGGYFSSEGWSNLFLIHDDNFGPYKTFPRNYFEGEGDVILWGLHKDRAALCFERIETRALGVCWDFIHKNKGQERRDYTWYNQFLHCIRLSPESIKRVFVVQW